MVKWRIRAPFNPRALNGEANKSGKKKIMKNWQATKYEILDKIPEYRSVEYILQH